MVPSKSSNSEHVAKIRESEEDVLEVLVLDTKDLSSVVSVANVLILISQLENITYLSKVAAWIKSQEDMIQMLIVHINLSFHYKVYALTLHI